MAKRAKKLDSIKRKTQHRRGSNPMTGHCIVIRRKSKAERAFRTLAKLYSF